MIASSTNSGGLGHVIWLTSGIFAVNISAVAIFATSIIATNMLAALN